MAGDDYKSDGGEEIGALEDWNSVSSRSTATDGLDTVFDLLCDSRRRHLLYYFDTVEGDVVELPVAVNAVYKYEAAETEPGDQLPREQVRIALHHEHLPRLSNAGILEYDHRQGTIRLTERNRLEEWVELARSKELE